MLEQLFVIVLANKCFMCLDEHCLKNGRGRKGKFFWLSDVTPESEDKQQSPTPPSLQQY